MRRIYGKLEKHVCTNLGLRHDWGPQYASKDFAKELEYLGIKNSPGFEHEPETNGVIERFFRTAKEEHLWVEQFRDVDHARERVGAWMELYNTQWEIKRLKYRSPREVREQITASQTSPAPQVA